ncbi:hypothetical protein JCM17823_09120 [Halorubrum gandharaense]
MRVREATPDDAVNDRFVREGHRGEGHGTRLLSEAEELAAAEDCDFLRLSAEWENDGARRLYEREGYTPKQATYTKRL